MDTEIKEEFIKIYNLLSKAADRETVLLSIIKQQDKKIALLSAQVLAALQRSRIEDLSI